MRESAQSLGPWAVLVFGFAGALLAVAGLWPWGLALVVAVVALLMADRETARPTP